MNESPALMRAVGYNANPPADDPASLLDVEVPVPALQPHDLLVEVHAVSVNPVNAKERAHSDPHGAVRILGFGAAPSGRRNAMTRTPQEVFAHHGQAFGAGDLDEIVADFADDAVVITPAGVNRGKDGVREAFTQLFADLPNAAWDLKTQIYGDDVLMLEWAADGAESRADDGVDTFVFRDGLIHAQTVHYTLQRKG
jgi:hypothetical protein